MPLPARNAGFRSLVAIAVAKVRVVVTRLSRSSRAHFAECGLPAVGEPARLTTTSAVSITSRSYVPAYGSQLDSSGADVGRRTRARTACPRATRALLRSDPRK